jgi:hypothetical protein
MLLCPFDEGLEDLRWHRLCPDMNLELARYVRSEHASNGCVRRIAKLQIHAIVDDVTSKYISVMPAHIDRSQKTLLHDLHIPERRELILDLLVIADDDNRATIRVEIARCAALHIGRG